MLWLGGEGGGFRVIKLKNSVGTPVPFYYLDTLLKGGAVICTGTGTYLGTVPTVLVSKIYVFTEF